MFVQKEIFLFPTDNKPSKLTIWKHVKTGELSLWKDVMSVDKNWYPFELYVVDDYQNNYSNTHQTFISDGEVKFIIATTNDNLYQENKHPNFGSYMTFSLGSNFPTFSKEFIIWYCEVGGVNVVDIEVDERNNLIVSNKEVNIIIPNETKSNWDKQEVIQLLYKREQHIQDNFAPNKSILSIDKWIELNLK